MGLIVGNRQMLQALVRDAANVKNRLYQMEGTVREVKATHVDHIMHGPTCVQQPNNQDMARQDFLQAAATLIEQANLLVDAAARHIENTLDA